MVEITATEQNIGKRMKTKNEQSLRETSRTTLNTPNVHIIGVPEGDKRKDLRKYSKR